MKMTVDEAIQMLNNERTSQEIFIWFRTINDYDVNPRKWSELEDDSNGLEEIIDDFMNGWIEED